MVSGLSFHFRHCLSIGRHEVSRNQQTGDIQMTKLLRRHLLALMLGVTTATLIMPLTFDAAAYADDNGSNDHDSGSDNDSSGNDDNGSDDNGSNDDNGSDDDGSDDNDNGSDDNGSDDNDGNDDNGSDDNGNSSSSGDDGCKSDPLTCKLRALTK